MYNGRKGILYQKMFYRKYVKKNRKCLENPEEMPSEMDDAIATVAEQIHQMSIEEELEYLTFFRTCLIDRDKEILKIKMKQSICLREKHIRKRETKFAASFPFYFVSPDLVNFYAPIFKPNDLLTLLNVSYLAVISYHSILYLFNYTFCVSNFRFCTTMKFGSISPTV